jgi:two-component sensor histidine kinase
VVLDVPLLDLDVTLAVPLGLIVNEAMTNALKYALPGGEPGTVRLALHRQAPGTDCELTIADDGPGLPPGYDPSRSRSLGMTLMHGLAEQLGGELRLSGPPGVTLRLSFPDAQPGRPVTGAGYGQPEDVRCGT